MDDNKILTTTNGIVSGITIILAIILDLSYFLPEEDVPAMIIIVAIGLLWSYLGRYVGLKKGINSGYIWGYCLGFIGLVIVCILPSENNNINNNIFNNRNTNLVNVSVTDEIKKYKELLDAGAITEEEYNIKKKELLNL